MCVCVCVFACVCMYMHVMCLYTGVSRQRDNHLLSIVSWKFPIFPTLFSSLYHAWSTFSSNRTVSPACYGREGRGGEGRGGEGRGGKGRGGEGRGGEGRGGEGRGGEVRGDQ